MCGPTNNCGQKGAESIFAARTFMAAASIPLGLLRAAGLEGGAQGAAGVRESEVSQCGGGKWCVLRN